MSSSSVVTPSPQLGASDALRAFEASLHLQPNHTPITPISSSEDKRKYRVITLSNGLTALLISDPETDKAAASLDVNIGSFAEPSDALGLAHFLEHMLFMGTEKYPEENSYSLAINNYGGSQNAYTTREHTNYIFDCGKAHLEEILDRFAQFFVAPLCLRSGVDRELNAVNNEHEKNIQNDYWRIAQVSESALNADHPISRFATGNFLTLRDEPKAKGIDTRERLLTFYHSHYSANLMKLCVCGMESLDQLEKYVQTSFANVKNLNRERPDYTSIPIAVPGKHTANLMRIVPVKNYRSLEIEFILPPIHHLYLADPSKLIGHILAHEAEGSLAAYLKAEGLVNSLTAHEVELNSSYALGKIDAELTPAGLERIEDIIESIYSYIHMVRDSILTNPEVWAKEIYEEVKAVETMDFTFAEKIDPIDFCEQQASRLSHLPAKHVLSGGCLETYDYENLKNISAIYADINSARVRVIAPEFKSLAGLQKEQWYQTEYTLESMSPELIQRCRTPKKNPAFKIPKVNHFIATDFTLKHKQRTEQEKKDGVQNKQPKRLQCCGGAHVSSNSSSSSVPTTNDSSSSSQLFFVADTTFELPKANITIQISNNAVTQNALYKNCSAIWSDLIDDALSELNHYAEEAGISSYSYPTNGGLVLSYFGYSHKLKAFISEIVPKFKAIKAVDRVAQFERLKEALFRKLTEYDKETPLSHARNDANQLRLELHTSYAEQLVRFDDLTPQAVDNFSAEWFGSGQVYVLANGNIVEEEAQEIVKIVEQAFPLKPLLPSAEYTNRCINLSSQYSYVRQVKSKNLDDTNSCIFNLYQIGVADELIDAHMSVVSHILGDALFDQLRTRETLGYLVSGYHDKCAGVLWYRIAVQSSDASPAYLNLRVEAFLHWFRRVKFAELLKESSDFLETNKQAVIRQLTEKDKNLGDEHHRLWAEIEKRRFDFDRRQRVAKQVESITLQSFYDFFDRYLLGDSPSSQRKKVSIQYFSAAHEIPKQEKHETKENVAFGNEKLVLRVVDGAKAPEAAAAPVAAAAPATPAEPAEVIYLPPAPVDPRERIYVDHIVEFKRAQPTFPSAI